MRGQPRSRFGQSHPATRAASGRFRGIFFALGRTGRPERQQSLDGSHIRSSALGDLGDGPRYALSISKPATGRSPPDRPDREKAQRTGRRTARRFRTRTPPNLQTPALAETRNPQIQRAPLRHQARSRQGPRRVSAVREAYPPPREYSQHPLPHEPLYILRDEIKLQVHPVPRVQPM